MATSAFGILQMLLGLALVLALIVLASWALKRFGAGTMTSGSAIKVLTAASVGPRERVVLVEVGDTWLLLGVAPGRVSSLHQLPRQAIPLGEASQPGFAGWLALARRNRETAK